MRIYCFARVLIGAALFSPLLPKWANFSIVLSDIAEHFSGNSSGLVTLKGNVRFHPVSVGFL